MSPARREASIVILDMVGWRSDLGIGFDLALLVCPGLSVPESFLLVVVSVPGCLKVFDYLFCGSVWSYHGLDEDVEGRATEVGAFRQMGILKDARLLRLITGIQMMLMEHLRKGTIIKRDYGPWIGCPSLVKY